jgi:hypothetical protein
MQESIAGSFHTVHNSRPMNSTRTQPLNATFWVLTQPQNLASIEVLEFALRCEIPAIRIGGVQALLARNGSREMETIVRCIDLCDAEEISLLKSHSALFLTPVEAALASREPETRQRGLVAIAKLQLHELFHFLVASAESADDPQQVVSAQLLDDLATEFGTIARKHSSYRAFPARERLLNDLLISVGRYSKHRNNAIVDAFLLCCHWDDDCYRELFSPMAADGFPVALKRLKQLNHDGANELMCGSFWANNPNHASLEILMDCDPPKTLRMMSTLEKRFTATPSLKRNFANVPLPLIKNLDLAAMQLDSIDVKSLLRLLVATGVNEDVLIHNVNFAAKSNDHDTNIECINAIRALRKLKSEIVVMVLSDCFDRPDIEPYEPPPWKASYRSALEKLLDSYYDLPSSLRIAVNSALSEFKTEDLFRHAEGWPESHVKAYGRIARLVDKDCLDFLTVEIHSQSHSKRANAIRMLRYLGNDEQLMEFAIIALNDPNESVRVEAVQAVAYGHDRDSAIELLSPLISDEESNVSDVAAHSIRQLESFRNTNKKG